MAIIIKYEDFARLGEMPRDEQEHYVAQLVEFAEILDLPKDEQDEHLARTRTSEYVFGLESGSAVAISRILRQKADIAKLIPKILNTDLSINGDIDGMMAYMAGYQDGLRQPISGLNQGGTNNE